MTKLDAMLAQVALDYGRDPDPCPFCGGMDGRRGHLLLTREDGKTTRCQVGDVRELARTLAAQAEEREREAGMVAGVMADAARDRETVERWLAHACETIVAGERFVFGAVDGSTLIAEGEGNAPGEGWRVRKREPGKYGEDLILSDLHPSDALIQATRRRDEINDRIAAETRDLSPVEVSILRHSLPGAPDVVATEEHYQAIGRLFREKLVEKGECRMRDGVEMQRIVTTESGKRALARMEGKS